MPSRSPTESRHGNQADRTEGPDVNYVVVLVAKGGARLEPDEGIKITGFNTDAGPAAVGLGRGFKKSVCLTGCRTNTSSRSAARERT
jgi:hypothetical protein